MYGHPQPWYGPYVGQVATVGPSATGYFDPTTGPNWPGARALVRSTIQSVLSSDAIFDQVLRQIVQYLVQQGFVSKGDLARVLRPAFVTRLRTWVRQALYFADFDTIIDVATRQLVHYAQAHRLTPFD